MYPVVWFPKRMCTRWPNVDSGPSEVAPATSRPRSTSLRRGKEVATQKVWLKNVKAGGAGQRHNSKPGMEDLCWYMKRTRVMVVWVINYHLDWRSGKKSKRNRKMISSFLLIALVEVICASKTVNTVGRKRNLNQDQEKLEWALDQLPHHRTKRCQKIKLH